MTEENEVQKAQELLKAKEQELINNFQKEYQELCEKHGFGLMPSITIKGDGSVVPLVEVVKL